MGDRPSLSTSAAVSLWRVRHLHTAISVAAMTLLATTPSKASTFDTFGFSARAMAMANAYVALGTDYDAVYYNPANVLGRKRTHVGVGFNLIAPSLAVDRTSGAETFRPLFPEAQSGIHLGGSTPLSGIFNDVVGVGFALFHPLTTGTKVESIDPRTPTFYRFQNLPDKLVLALSVAYEPVEWLRIGVGVQLLAAFEGQVTGALDLTEGRFTRENLDVDITPVMAPTAGIALGSFAGWRFGATFRGALQLDYSLPVVVRIEGVGDLDVLVRGTSLYTPPQLAFGLSWESAPPSVANSVALELGATWDMWSGAPPAGAYFELAIDGAELRPTGPDGQPVDIVDVLGEPVPIGAVDTLTGRIGAEWRVDPTWTLRAGYAYRPTPIPTPIYQGNTLDATSHIASAGGTVTFGDPTGVLTAPVHIDLGLQVTALKRRSVQKAVDGSPDGSYAFGGTVWHLSLDLRHDYF